MVGKVLQAFFNVAVLPKIWNVQPAPLHGPTKGMHKCAMVYGYIAYHSCLNDASSCTPIYGNDADRHNTPQYVSDCETFPRVAPFTAHTSVTVFWLLIV